MDYKVCTKCQCNLPLDNFSWKNKGKGTRSSECRKCHSVVRKAYYLKNKDTEIQNAKASKRNRLPVIAEKYKVLKKSLCCSRCGQTHPATLQFHHTDSSEKEYSVSKMVRGGWSIEGILKEISKCEVLCANCHSIEHYGKYFE